MVPEKMRLNIARRFYESGVPCESGGRPAPAGFLNHVSRAGRVQNRDGKFPPIHARYVAKMKRRPWTLESSMVELGQH